MLMSRKIFNELRGFDEDYLIFSEDVDYCFRAQKAGYRILYYPYIEVIHTINLSKNTSSIKIHYQRHRSMWIYYYKHLLRNPLLAMVVFIVISLRFLFTTPSVLFHFLRKSLSFKKSTLYFVNLIYRIIFTAIT